MHIENYTLNIDFEPECDVQDVTPAVREKLSESGVTSGQVLVFVVGSTGAVTTVEYEPGCVRDLRDLFDKLAPPTRDYHHEQTWHDGNGFSHMRASLLKPSLIVPVQNGKMRLGTWQQIVVINFDNKSRTREIAVQVMGNSGR